MNYTILLAVTVTALHFFLPRAAAQAECYYGDKRYSEGSILCICRRVIDNSISIGEIEISGINYRCSNNEWKSTDNSCIYLKYESPEEKEWARQLLLKFGCPPVSAPFENQQ